MSKEKEPALFELHYLMQIGASSQREPRNKQFEKKNLETNNSNLFFAILRCIFFIPLIDGVLKRIV